MANSPPRERRSQSPVRRPTPRSAGAPAAASPVVIVPGAPERDWLRFTLAGAAGGGAGGRIRRPLAVGDLPGRGRERSQRGGHRRLLTGREPGQDAGQQRPPPGGRLIHHLPARRGDRNLHGPAIGAGPVPADQTLAQQPVTHPARGRRRDIERRGQIRHPLRAPGGKHHQGPILGDRDVVRGRAQRCGGHRHQRAARRQHRVHRGLVRHVLSHASPANLTCLLQRLHNNSIGKCTSGQRVTARASRPGRCGRAGIQRR